MILSGKTIRTLGIITPHLPKTEYRGVSFGESGGGYDIRAAEGVTLLPGRTHLIVTMEQFLLPCNVSGEIRDKSTWARCGVLVRNTDIEPGWRGFLTLEVSYLPLAGAPEECLVQIEAGQGIAQAVFSFLDSEAEPYNGKYQDAVQVAQRALWR